MFCENESNIPKLFGGAPSTPYPKDGINDHVVNGAATVNPERRGTKMACWYRVTVGAGETVELRLRLARDVPGRVVDLAKNFEQTLADRKREADEYYAALRPEGTSDEEASVMRQAFSGMTWSMQFYHYDVPRWLEGDKLAPPEARKSGRNSVWRHLSNHHIVAMPDKWEYPWYASWDLAFHSVILAHSDPTMAKNQLLLLAREWYMHPNGQLPAYEWNFSDVNPPVQAWAALAVFRIDGATDFDFLARVFNKLLINFTWWVNREDERGDNIFEGGFLGLDNIGPFDRSKMLKGEVLEQSDGTAWMAKYCLNMLEIALLLANRNPVYEDVAIKFFEHFALIAAAMDRLWDEQDGFFYDRLRTSDGSAVTVRARSMVGLLPVFAAVELDVSLWQRLPMFRERARWYLEHKLHTKNHLYYLPSGGRPGLISLVEKSRFQRILARMLDESEFLSPYGLRSLSRYHLEHPLVLNFDGRTCRLDYEPGESRSGLFGGNSNWRGPVWSPLNFLAIESLRHLHNFFGDELTVELPTGSGRRANLSQVAAELERRLLSLFRLDANGRRPAHGANPRFQKDPVWRDSLLFYEYFHAETGEGLGASHQTGWTALAGALIARRRATLQAAKLSLRAKAAARAGFLDFARFDPRKTGFHFFVSALLGSPDFANSHLEPLPEQRAKRGAVDIADGFGDPVDAGPCRLQEMHRALDPEIPDMGERRLADDLAHPPGQGPCAGADRGGSGPEPEPLAQMIARPAVEPLHQRVGMRQMIGNDVGGL